MGSVAGAVERSGGNVARVFARADLPLRLIDQPDRLILLRDQLRLLECAAREIGDPALSARLSLEAGVAGLGALGQQVLAADRLDAAITRANLLMGSLLQSSTRLQLIVRDGMAKWSYVVTDSSDVGRQKNEILALGYMVDLARRFMGPSWTPTRAVVSGSTLQAKSAIEQTLGADLSLDAVCSLCFPAAQLTVSNPVRPVRHTGCEHGVCEHDSPIKDDLLSCVEHLILLKLLERRPSIDWISGRLGLSRRSLQRRLAERGTTFEAVLSTALERQATTMLERRDCSISEIAYELGYADPGHFTRAFVAWKGISPRAWRLGWERNTASAARTIIR